MHENVCKLPTFGKGPSINYIRTVGEGGGSNLLYISIAYYMQKWGQGVQIACKNAYVINGRPLNSVNKDWKTETVMKKSLNFYKSNGKPDIRCLDKPVLGHVGEQ